MGTRYLLDSNIVIYFQKTILPPNARSVVQNAIDEDDCFLSIISKMELLGWNFDNRNQESLTEGFINELNLLNLNEAVVQNTIEIRKKQPKIKLPDAIIGATALAHDLILLSRNTSDFVKIDGLRLVNPFDL